MSAEPDLAGPGPPPRCPRCNSKDIRARSVDQNARRWPGGDWACFAGDCAWPRPEPGPITALRLQGPQANDILQQRRAQGTWPPVP